MYLRILLLILVLLTQVLAVRSYVRSKHTFVLVRRNAAFASFVLVGQETARQSLLETKRRSLAPPTPTHPARSSASVELYQTRLRPRRAYMIYSYNYNVRESRKTHVLRLSLSYTLSTRSYRAPHLHLTVGLPCSRPPCRVKSIAGFLGLCLGLAPPRPPRDWAAASPTARA